MEIFQHPKYLDGINWKAGYTFSNKTKKNVSKQNKEFVSFNGSMHNVEKGYCYYFLSYYQKLWSFNEAEQLQPVNVNYFFIYDLILVQYEISLIRYSIYFIRKIRQFHGEPQWQLVMLSIVTNYLFVCLHHIQRGN